MANSRIVCFTGQHVVDKCNAFEMAPHAPACSSAVWDKHCTNTGGALPYKEYLDRTTLNGYNQFTKGIADKAFDGDADAISQCLLKDSCEFVLS